MEKNVSGNVRVEHENKRLSICIREQTYLRDHA